MHFFSYDLKTHDITKHYTKMDFMSHAGIDQDFQVGSAIHRSKVIGKRYILSRSKTRFKVPLKFIMRDIKPPLFILEHHPGLEDEIQFDFNFPMIELIKELKAENRELRKRFNSIKWKAPKTITRPSKINEPPTPDEVDFELKIPEKYRRVEA